ncbi:MAG: SDR family oxidoreductase [Anaeromyxobacteraceae bacterium]
MILVTGATGHLGRLVVEGLTKKVPAAQIVAGARTPAKASDLAARGVQVRHLDYDRPETIEAALRGVEKVLLVSGSEMGRRLPQHTNVVNAVARARPKLLVYTSILKADRSRIGLADEHLATEKLVTASGVPYVLLRDGWYIENYTANLAGALASGVLLGAAGSGKVSPAARADYAEAAVAVLTQDGHAGKTYELAGDRAYTLADLAADIAKGSGKPVRYQDLPEREYSGMLQKFGLPAPVADMLANADVGLSLGDLEDSSGTLQKLIGRPTTTFAEGVAAALQG